MADKQGPGQPQCSPSQNSKPSWPTGPPSAMTKRADPTASGQPTPFARSSAGRKMERPGLRQSVRDRLYSYPKDGISRLSPPAYCLSRGTEIERQTDKNGT